MQTAWRLLKSRHTAAAFRGDGARLYGGRWNSVGTAVVYAAGSISLAVLEVLVHLQSTAPFGAYSLMRVDFDVGLVESLDVAKLPPSWADSPPSREAQRIGDEWAAETRSAVLRVPSAVVPQEHNFLLNPAHRDFAKIRIGKATPFRFDPRLLER